MELRDFVEIGAKKAGSLTALGKLLDISQPTISGVKAHKRALTVEGAVKLADYIGADLRAVIAANELVTEKKEEKRRFWAPFVEHARAASFALVVTSACGTFFVSPTPAEAAPSLTSRSDTICIMLNRQLRRHSKKRQLSRSFKLLLESFFSLFAARSLEMQPI